MRVTGILTEEEALRAVGGRSRPAEAAVRYAPPRPPIYGDSDRWAALEARMPEQLPATRVLELPGASVLGKAGWVGIDDRVIPSVTWYEQGQDDMGLDDIIMRRELRLAGSLLNLSTMNGLKNYGHFLMDGIGRLSVAELAGVGVQDADWVMVPGLDTDGSRRMLDAAGIPPHKRIVPARRAAITPEVLLAPSMPGTTRVYRPSLCRYLRTLVEPGPEPVRRLYITRHDVGRRPLTNRADVDRLVVPAGFTPVDPMLVNLPQLMTTADMVIGEHGAALADLAFCRPGTKVIELIPSDHMQPYYYSIAMAAELDYSAVVCQSAEIRPPSSAGPSPHSVEVPLDALAEALAAMLG